jgi:hypothetical protein
MKKELIIFIFLAAISSCNRQKNDADIFNGKLSIIEEIDTITKLTSSQIFLNDIYTFGPNVYDSLLLFVSYKYQHHFVSVFSLNSGDLLGEFVQKGQGHNEYISINWRGQFIVENNEIKIWFNAVPNYRIFLLNLTASIREQRTVIDREIKFGMPHSPNGDFFQYVFCTKDRIIAKTQTAWFDQTMQYTPAEYYSFDIVDLKQSNRFKLFNKPIMTARNIASDECFISSDKINPSRTKIAMGMNWTKQINILDIATGQLNGFRVKSSTTFDDFNSSKPLFWCYEGVYVDDQYIYGMYMGSPLAETGSEHFDAQSDEVHVFTWDGKMIAKLSLDHPANVMDLDVVNKYLYIVDKVEENIYRYDLQFLYQ